MSETANILHDATTRSLILLDEIGRGTSTFDGLSIAWAVTEYLHNRDDVRPWTMFATHYHELTELEDVLPRLKNMNVLVRETDDSIVFLRKIAPGAADQSYGIEVARLAGIPREVIVRAREVLENLESSQYTADAVPRLAGGEHGPLGPGGPQLRLFDAAPSEVELEIEGLELEQMTPLDAFDKLVRAQEAGEAWRSRIRILGESVANRIAAGEVVEAPHSVVKELVENALDAGASEIAVDIKGGGSDLVRVSDNGVRHEPRRRPGRVRPLRHEQAHDRGGPRQRSRHLGFRGEALPSIASVSRIRLVTCEDGDVEGTEVDLVGGEVRDVRPAGRARGTTVEVSSLFFNTPARRKFLKSDSVEIRRIMELMTEYAVLYPSIRFDVAVDGKLVARAHVHGQPRAARGRRPRQQRERGDAAGLAHGGRRIRRGHGRDARP